MLYFYMSKRIFEGSFAVIADVIAISSVVAAVVTLVNRHRESRPSNKVVDLHLGEQVVDANLEKLRHQ